MTTRFHRKSISQIQAYIRDGMLYQSSHNNVVLRVNSIKNFNVATHVLLEKEECRPISTWFYNDRCT
jgi:protein associated with RNAse G/E